jgi:biopolymer transport protein ExbD
MRKFVLSILALFVCVGITIAASVKFVSYDEDKKELVVKDGDKEKTYKLDDKTKYINNKSGKEIASDKVAARMKKLKKDEDLEVTADGDKATEVKVGKKN